MNIRAKGKAGDPEMDGWHLEKAQAGISNGLIIVITVDDSGNLGSDGNKRTKFFLDSCLAMTHNLHVCLTQKNKPFRKGKEKKKPTVQVIRH